MAPSNDHEGSVPEDLLLLLAIRSIYSPMDSPEAQIIRRELIGNNRFLFLYFANQILRLQEDIQSFDAHMNIVFLSNPQLLDDIYELIRMKTLALKGPA